jgi:hypothetical protein
MVKSSKFILPFSSSSDVNFCFGNQVLNSDNMSLMSVNSSL